eukprot:jgi/Picsp_1/4994/NSC_02357-R1_trna pseudouridine synthase a
MDSSNSILSTHGTKQFCNARNVLCITKAHHIAPGDFKLCSSEFHLKWYHRVFHVRRNRFYAMDIRRHSHVVWSSVDPAPSLSQKDGVRRVPLNHRSAKLKSERFKYIIDVAYDGTNYKGFQLQPKVPTIQGRLEKALTKHIGLDRSELLVQGSSRTDSGVHAKQQLVEFYSDRELNEEKFIWSINRMLPFDISVSKVSGVGLERSIRHSFGKIYTYDIHLERIRDPFVFKFRHMPAKPDLLRIDKMVAALPLFIGDKDFKLLSNRSPDHDDEYFSTVRRIYDFQATDIDGGIRVACLGKGFMYKQMRHMVGALLSLGYGDLDEDDVLRLLLQHENTPQADNLRILKTRYKVAESKGLCLQRVFLSELPEYDSLFNLI